MIFCAISDRIIASKPLLRGAITIEPQNQNKPDIFSMCENCTVPNGMIADVAKVPMYARAVRRAYVQYGKIGNREFYKAVRDAYFDMLYKEAFGFHNSDARKTLKNISKFLYGNSHFWENELPDELEDVARAKRMGYSYSLPSIKLYKIFRYPELTKAFSAYEVFDDVTAYDICKTILFELKQDELYKDSEKIKEVEEIVEDYARAIGINPHRWMQDYEEFLETKTFTIRKASRNGGYEKITVTEEEAARMLQYDEQLEDVGEDL